MQMEEVINHGNKRDIIGTFLIFVIVSIGLHSSQISK